LTFHPGMRVRVTLQDDAMPPPPFTADIIEVVTPDRIEDLQNPFVPAEQVRRAMQEEGVASTLILKAPFGVLVVEVLRAGSFRVFHSRHRVLIETQPAEFKIEVQ
jgi:hypothetical protein